jgi:8-hydroxy-5-deazaflavin:NADPH oxidoreductase
MQVAVIGTGFIGGILGRALSNSGHRVVFGSRSPADDAVAGGTSASVGTIDEALAGAEAVILALPGQAVGELVSEHDGGLAGKLVVDATNQMGSKQSNSRSALPPTVRYARAFNTLGGENMEQPVFPDGRADMFFSAPLADRESVAKLVEGVGLRPVYVGEDQEALIDALFQLWIALAVKQGRGRRLAFRLLEGGTT